MRRDWRLGSLGRVAFDVVIAGGGFGGLYAARRLERRLPRYSARIIVVSDVNFLLYSPLLPGAAAGSLEPRHVVVPIREELEWADLRLGRVTGADPGVNELYIRTLDERDETLRYDQLVVALGSVSRVLPVPGLADHALGFKTLADAIAVRNRALISLEIAESLPDDESRREYLTFLFVGAGYAGVEGIAELQDYVNATIERYPRCRETGTRWIIADMLDRIMPEIPESLAEFASQELRGRGIELRTGTKLERMDERSAVLSTGERVPTRTVCWTAGVKPPAVVRELGLPLTNGGRIETDASMRVKGQHNVWAIGDAAAVPDPAQKRKAPSPPTAQHAIRQGRVVGSNVAAALAGKKPRPFRYRTLGVFVDLGQHKAVATMLGIRLRGFPAWFAARSYHLAMIPGAARRVRIAADWTVGLLFGRASAELGQLGHPPSLQIYLDEAQQRDEAPGQ
jgi:NADH:ubiquinone reductase (H+-translocating)